MSLNYFKDADFEEAKTADQAIVPGLASEMEKIAEDHGFSPGLWGKLIFEDWLFATDTDDPSYDTNLALINFDPDAVYLAVVKRPYYDINSVVVFKISPEFLFGEPWRYQMEVLYIAATYDSSQVLFDSRYNTDQGHLLLSIMPGIYDYEVRSDCGLDIKLLRRDLYFAISELCRLLGLRADGLDEELHKERYMMNYHF